MKVLSTKGPGALSIDNLCLIMGKTKGSFYHHFGNRESYIGELLEYHEKNTMDEIMEIANQAEDAPKKIKSLTKMTFQISGDLELSIRAWALYEPMVRNYQDRLDLRRLDYLKQLHMESGLSAERAQMRANRDYSLFIGFQQLKHHHNGDEFKKIVKYAFSNMT